jgi:hypothetical protein
VGEKSNAHNNLIGKTEGKRPLGRPKRRWEKIVTIDSYTA